MTKNKIALKLSLYFALALLSFSLVIGTVFMVLFKNYTINIYKKELSSRATSIAQVLSGYLTRSGMNGMGSMGGMGSYLRFIDQIAGTDIWVVDENLNLITSGALAKYEYSDLPENADTLIKEVFNDQVVFSEDFSGILKELTLTVGTPIKSSTGKILGVVLLHSSVFGMNEAIQRGFALLGLSIFAALCISFLLSVGFSITFTQPLNKMKNTALRLASGDYSAANKISQKDEIGSLANTMDILAERLQVASTQSARLEQMRRDFVANISHELRTPVTVIRGSLEALVDKIVTEPEQVEDYHRQMLKEATLLQRLVGDLLDLSRLQNTEFAMDMQELFISDVLSDATRSIEQLAAKKGVKISVVKDTDSCKVIGDYVRLRQLLIILLDNAVKFSNEGGEIKVALYKGTLNIRDYGIGIPKEDLPYIFDRFYKSRSEENKTGTGLGLAIAKEIAERHGFRLYAKSTIAKGSLFIIEGLKHEQRI